MPPLPPTHTCCFTVHNTVNTAFFETVTFCQLPPTSKDLCTMPSTESLHCGIETIFIIAGVLLVTVFCCRLPVIGPPTVPALAGAVSTSAAAPTLAETAAALTSTVSLALPGSSLTPTAAGLSSATATSAISLDLNPAASVLIEYEPDAKELKTKFPCASEVAVFDPTGPFMVTLALFTSAPDGSTTVP